MIRIVIVDDHEVVRQGLRYMLEQRSDIEVIGEGSDGKEAIALTSELLPDIILLDLLMPNMGGIEAVREIKRLTPSTKIIVLTSFYENDQIFGAIKAGALSYLLKEGNTDDLLQAIYSAARGESILHPLVAAQLLKEVRDQAESPLKDLTPRELEVLTRIARGHSNSEIAAELAISEPTVRMHVANILMKLHVADRTQAAIFALQKKLVPLKDALEDKPERHGEG